MAIVGCSIAGKRGRAAQGLELWDNTSAGFRFREVRVTRGQRVRAFLALAREPSVVRRALKFAVVVGSVLIAINHGDAILRGDLEPGRIARMALTTMVPYVVSTLSSVGAMMQTPPQSRAD